MILLKYLKVNCTSLIVSMLSTETLSAELWSVVNHVLACLVHAIGKKYNSTESKVNWIDEKSTEYMKSDLKL